MTSRTGRHRLLLTVHIGVTIAVLGAGLALLALGIAGLRGMDPAPLTPWRTYSASGWPRHWRSPASSPASCSSCWCQGSVAPLRPRPRTPPHVTHTQRLLYTIAPAAAAILLAVNLTLARYGQARAGTPRPYRVGRPRARVSPGPANL